MPLSRRRVAGSVLPCSYPLALSTYNSCSMRGLLSQILQVAAGGSALLMSCFQASSPIMPRWGVEPALYSPQTSPCPHLATKTESLLVPKIFYILYRSQNKWLLYLFLFTAALKHHKANYRRVGLGLWLQRDWVLHGKESWQQTAGMVSRLLSFHILNQNTRQRMKWNKSEAFNSKASPGKHFLQERCTP